jgi:nicotinamidase-related amidase
VDLTIARQIILEKEKLNLFSNPNLPRLLEILEADEYVVYGVVTEYCVHHAALGLLETGKPVTLITDAIRSLNNEESARTIQAFTTRGGKLANEALWGSQSWLQPPF